MTIRYGIYFNFEGGAENLLKVVHLRCGITKDIMIYYSYSKDSKEVDCIWNLEN